VNHSAETLRAKVQLEPIGSNVDAGHEQLHDPGLFGREQLLSRSSASRTVASGRPSISGRAARQVATTTSGERSSSGPFGRVVATGMNKISYAGYRFPPEIIHQAIWLYLRFGGCCAEGEEAVQDSTSRPSEGMRL